MMISQTTKLILGHCELKMFDGKLESEPLKYHPTFANSMFSRVLLMSLNAQLQWVVRIIQIENSF